MTRIRRGNYIFTTWAGDHEPKHVHVYKDDKLVLRWNLEKWCPISGEPTKRILGILIGLKLEGKL